jgi:hypothetical protein
MEGISQVFSLAIAGKMPLGGFHFLATVAAVQLHCMMSAGLSQFGRTALRDRDENGAVLFASPPGQQEQEECAARTISIGE